jgi:SulP family sulfate permease
VDVDQELVAQGLANIAVGFFRGYPVSASFSRTAINIAAGAKTGISSVVAAFAVLLILFLVSPILYYIPLSVLAAIVIVSVIELVDLRRLRELYMKSRTDGIIAATAFLTACILRPYDAVLIGVIVALSLTIHRIMWARVRKLGLETEWRILQAVGTSPTVQTFPGVLMVRAETSAFYGNIEYIISRIDEYIVTEEQSGTFVKSLVLECSSINYMDLSSAELLHEYAVALKETGTSVYAVYVHSGVQDRLERIGALDDIVLVHNINELMRVADIAEPTHPGSAVEGSPEEKEDQV